jgi:hypothetical protein
MIVARLIQAIHPALAFLLARFRMLQIDLNTLLYWYLSIYLKETLTNPPYLSEYLSKGNSY